jgi:hypothetical protein
MVPIPFLVLSVACVGKAEPGGTDTPTTGGLAARVAALEAENADLQADLADLQASQAAQDSILAGLAGVAAVDAAQQAELDEHATELAALGADLASRGPGTHFFDDIVFTGQSPAEYTVLDLSAWTGGTRALVFVRGAVIDGDVSADVHFRRADDDPSVALQTDDIAWITASGDGGYGYALVETDDTGQVEWWELDQHDVELRVRAVIQ